jgi:predicted regulator of Ras-like GTPase activity (Roadblock/LC7/MglB family)
MSFEPTLQKMIDACPGALGIAMMGSVGIPVADIAGPDPEGADVVGGAGVEFGRILEEVRKASDALTAGRLEELIVGLARFTLVFRAVDDELFVVVALAPNGNLGKARFLLRRHLGELREQL